jgi:hypothetical protein
MSSTRALILAVGTDEPPRKILIRNDGGTVYLGDGAVTDSTGFALQANVYLILVVEPGGGLHGIRSGGSSTMHVLTQLAGV